MIITEGMHSVPVTFALWDTPGLSMFRWSQLDVGAVPNIVILCFNLADKKTFIELPVYVSEISKHLVTQTLTLIIVVGTHRDCNPQFRQVSMEEGNAYARSLDAPYAEVNARDKDDVWGLFERAALTFRVNARVSQPFQRGNHWGSSSTTYGTLSVVNGTGSSTGHTHRCSC